MEHERNLVVSDTEQNVTERRRLKLSNLGSPSSMIKEKDKDGNFVHPARIPVGAIIGRVTGTVDLKNQDESVFVALKGTFEGESQLNGEIIKAGVLTLPSGFHDMMLENWYSVSKPVKDGGPGADAMEFAYLFVATRSDNPAGYVWAAEPLIKPQNAPDPLALLRQEVAAKRQAMLAGPRKGKGPTTIEGTAEAVDAGKGRSNAA